MSLLAASYLACAFSLLGSPQNQQRTELLDADLLRVKPAIVTIEDDPIGPTNGFAALIDTSGLFIANRATIRSTSMNGRLSDGRTVRLRMISQDRCTQLVLLQAETWANDVRPVQASRVDPDPGTQVLVVLTNGALVGTVTRSDVPGIDNATRRLVPLSEIRLEASSQSLKGALVFTRSGEFLGALNATLSRQADGMMFNQQRQSDLQSRGGGGGGRGNSLGGSTTFGGFGGNLRSNFGPAALTIAYSPTTDVLRRVFDGFKSDQHRVDHASIGLMCRDAVGFGASVESVAQGSPCSRAGILPGDIIVGINTFLVRNQIDFAKIMFWTTPGKKLTILVKRGNITLVKDLVAAKAIE